MRGRQAYRIRLAACITAAWCLAHLPLAVPLHAQVATGTILGNVKDNSGAPVPGAQVTATNLGTQASRTVTTDAEGQYALPLLPVGNYKLDVVLSGFKNFSQTGILLEVGRNARIDATIEPGNVTEVVSVTADASLVETNSSALSPLRQDKTFFFASYSGLRQEETYYRNAAVVPTARERAGDFSQSAIKPRDPLTNATFLNDIIPAFRMDAAALTIQDKYVPTSNLPNNFYEVRRPDPLNTDEATFKLDQHLSPTHGIAVSYFYLTGTDTQPLSGSGNIPWVDRDFKWNQHNLNVADTWTLSPTVINQLRVSYMRQFGGRVNNPTTSLGDLNSKFTIQGDPTLPRLTLRRHEGVGEGAGGRLDAFGHRHAAEWRADDDFIGIGPKLRRAHQRSRRHRRRSEA